MSTIIESLSDYETERGKPIPSTLHSLVQGNLIYLLKSSYKDCLIFPELSLDAPGSKPMVPDIAIYPKFEIDWQNDVTKQEKVPLATI